MVEESQDRIKKFDVKRGWDNNWDLKDLCLNLNEEIGELWNLIKWVDDEKQKQVLKDNHAEAENFIGDALFIIFKMANQMGVNAKKSVVEVIEELEKRMPIEKIKEIGHANKSAGGFDDKSLV